VQTRVRGAEMELDDVPVVGHEGLGDLQCSAADDNKRERTG